MAVAKNKNKQKNWELPLVIVVLVALVVLPLLFWLMRHNETRGMHAYNSNDYTFYYPDGWTININQRSDTNGTEYFLQPPDAAPPKTPHVTIDVAPAIQSAISTLTAPFSVFHYSETSTTVDGITAEEYTTIVPASEGVLHSIAYVFQTDNNIYVISLGYKQQATDTELENQFGKIVNTINAK
jgi:hypothetical protein